MHLHTISGGKGVSGGKRLNGAQTHMNHTFRTSEEKKTKKAISKTMSPKQPSGPDTETEAREDDEMRTRKRARAVQLHRGGGVSSSSTASTTILSLQLTGWISLRPMSCYRTDNWGGGG